MYILFPCATFHFFHISLDIVRLISQNMIMVTLITYSGHHSHCLGISYSVNFECVNEQMSLRWSEFRNWFVFLQEVYKVLQFDKTSQFFNIAVGKSSFAKATQHAQRRYQSLPH